MKIYLILLFLGLMVSGWADQFKIKNYTTENGLSSNSVFTTTRDQRGYVWLATADGLNRFDGYTFRSFSIEKFDTISGFDHVYRGMVIQKQSVSDQKLGCLWLATYSGLFCIDIASEETRVFRASDESKHGILSNLIRKIYLDSENRLWVATNIGLQYLMDGSNSFISIKELNGNDISSITVDAAGNLWVGTRESKIYRIPKDNNLSLLSGEIKAFQFDPDLVGRINCLYEDLYGNLWAGTELDGLWVIRYKNNSIQPFSVFNDSKYALGLHGINDIRSVLGDSSGLWIASFGGGLNRILFNEAFRRKSNPVFPDKFNLNSWPRKYNLNNSIISNYLHHLYLDFQNVLWVSSDDGVSKLNLNAKQFKFYIQNSNPHYRQSEIRVRAIFEDSNRQIWIGAINGGLSNLDLKNEIFFEGSTARELTNILGERTISAICEDRHGNLLIGSWGQGLFVKKPSQTGFQRFINNPEDTFSLPSNIVQAIQEDSRGNIWIGSFSGLSMFDFDKGKAITFNVFSKSKNPLPNNEIQSKGIFEDPFGNLWLGTYGGGLVVVKIDSAVALGPSRANFYSFSTLSTKGRKISNDFIISINGYLENDVLHIWCGSYAGGLLHLTFSKSDLIELNNDISYQNYSIIDRNNGLANDVVYGILKDKTGHLWVSTDNGISRINPQTKKVRNYKKSDGLPSNKYYWGAAYKSPDGLMMFGPQYGLLVFNPDQILDNRIEPEIQITGIKILGDYFSKNVFGHNFNDIDISYLQNSFSIEFSSLDLVNPQLNSYRFRLSGIDNAWQKVTGINHAIYNNVDPGNYVFELWGSNSDGYWSKNPQKMEIHVVPPFWMEFWFKFFALASTLYLIGLFLYRRNKNILRHNLELEEKNEQLIRQYQERKKAEQILIENEKKYRYLIENSADGIYLYFDGRFRLINSSFIKIFGFAEYEILSSEFDIYSIVEPEDRDAFKYWKEKTENQGSPVSVFEFSARTKSGEKRFVEIAISYFPYEQGFAEQGIIRDITDKKNMEEELLQLHKMEAVGRLAGGIAHDFNNLLTVIRGFSDLGLLKAKKNLPVDEIFVELEKATTQAENLTRQLLAFSRKQILKPEIFNINDLIKELDKIFKRLLEENIHLKLSLDSKLANVKIDRSKFTQVIMNLVINAKDAMPAGGELSIESKNVMVDESFMRDFSNIQPGPFVQISVNDSGVGMDSEVQKNVFEPFFTTKKTGKGTGLGLSMVYGVINQSGGFVTVYSEPGKGSSFKIYVPAILEKADKSHSKQKYLKELPGNIQILLVEDDDKVREIIENVLNIDTVKVYSAKNGDEGFKIFQQHQKTIDLIITDVIMPVMDGPQLVEKVKAIKPKQKILYMSGYTDNAVVQNGILDNDAEFIQKPFRGEELKNQVANILLSL